MKNIINRVLILLFLLIMANFCIARSERKVINLNGKWEISKTDGELPNSYKSSVLVPGLVDLANPAVDVSNTKYDKGWYWYKKVVNINSIDYEKIIIKINKAKYHTKLYLNNKYIGENLYCFTPSYFDIKKYLKEGNNTIIVGIGCRKELPDSIPDGEDREKCIYIPGIYDDVSLICSNTPYIENIQCVPDIENDNLKVVSILQMNTNKDNIDLYYKLSELSNKKQVVAKKVKVHIQKISENRYKACFTIQIPKVKLWTPENPFLYELHLYTEGDSKSCRFGMRTFRFDKDKKIALLNEKTYYLRGTNSCIFRFFEDSSRDRLPWSEKWVIKLFSKFKNMYWNSMRNTIGFPPERWYEICDSLGILLQDEYPLWSIKKNVKTKQLAEEYRRWMYERWNHPSVVIWDAQNELITDQTRPAIQEVRHLDLSNRPWENGWSHPDKVTDIMECHPYLFYMYQQDAWHKAVEESPEGYKKQIYGIDRIPDNNALSYKKNDEEYNNPLLINEYGWIWLNRDGSPTTLTDRVYDVLWNGKQLSPDKRLYIFARNMAMLTEYWRAHRHAAGVLHFCGLGYSRPKEPRGQTSDNWKDVKNLIFEKNFYKYVRPAFSPIGLMIDIWEKNYNAGAKYNVPIYVINDLDYKVQKQIDIVLMLDDKVLRKYNQKISLQAFQVRKFNVDIDLPKDAGHYILKAKLQYNNEEVFSVRDIDIIK